ncbi:MAG: DUF4389 domain-containing protein [Oceanobacter sp.]
MTDSSKFKENVRSDSFWLHTLYLIVFLLVARVLDFVLFMATLVQWLFRLLSESGHSSLNRFCYSLGLYYRDVTHFLTGCSSEKPFPFSDWPSAEAKMDAEPEPEVEPEKDADFQPPASSSPKEDSQ